MMGADTQQILSLAEVIDAVARDRGVVARCPCGLSRYCPFTERGNDDYEQFHQLHARCLPA
jgi:hypothetical protein